MNPCQKEDIINVLREDLKEIKQDVKSLLKFKWQIMGGAAFGGFILGTLMNFILKH